MGCQKTDKADDTGDRDHCANSQRQAQCDICKRKRTILMPSERATSSPNDSPSNAVVQRCHISRDSPPTRTGALPVRHAASCDSPPRPITKRQSPAPRNNWALRLSASAMAAPAKADTAKPAKISRKLDAPRPAKANKINTDNSAMSAAAKGTAK